MVSDTVLSKLSKYTKAGIFPLDRGMSAGALLKSKNLRRTHESTPFGGVVGASPIHVSMIVNFSLLCKLFY